MTQTYEAWRITYQSSEQAARAAFERMMELEQGKCLHQIAEPWKDHRTAALVNDLRDCAKTYAGTEQLRERIATIVAPLCDQLKAAERAQLPAAPQAVQPAVPQLKANCYSDDNGDYWRDCPDDCDFVEGLKVGDTYELQASIRAWPEIFRVTKAPDETSDDYEVELVSSDAPAHPAEGVPDPALSRACDLLSMTIGTLMGFRAKVGYTDNSPIAGLVNDAVEFLQPWPEKLPTATQPAAQGQDAQNLYYLQDARHHSMVGNCPSFWRPDGNGYTTNLDEAERFTFEEAMKQHKRRETDLPWLCAEVDKLRRPTVDCQYMPRSWDAQRAALAAQAKQGGEKNG